jgi:hypothetical protein
MAVVLITANLGSLFEAPAVFVPALLSSIEQVRACVNVAAVCAAKS